MPILRAEVAGNQQQQAGNALNYMGHKPQTMGENPSQTEDSMELSEAPQPQRSGASDKQSSVNDKPRCPTPYPEDERARHSYIPGLTQVDEENLRVKLKRKPDPNSGLELWIAETKSLKCEGADTPDSVRATDFPASPSPKSGDPDEVFK